MHAPVTQRVRLVGSERSVGLGCVIDLARSSERPVCVTVWTCRGSILQAPHFRLVGPEWSARAAGLRARRAQYSGHAGAGFLDVLGLDFATFWLEAAGESVYLAHAHVGSRGGRLTSHTSVLRCLARRLSLAHSTYTHQLTHTYPHSLNLHPQIYEHVLSLTQLSLTQFLLAEMHVLTLMHSTYTH